MSGIVRPHGGRVRFRGADITRAPAHKLVARGLVQVPEGRQILASLTVAENLSMGGWHRGRGALRAADHGYVLRTGEVVRSGPAAAGRHLPGHPRRE
jgi:branched-chain amino acid transport system ATP-binding protein